MIRKTFIFILLATISTVAFAQEVAQGGYVIFTPVPTEPPPNQAPITFPVNPLPPFPVPLYYPYSTPTSDSKPTISILSTYPIKSAKINGKDYSQHYVNAKAGIIVFKVPDKGANFMAIAIPGDNTYSYGAMLAVQNEETPQTATSYGKTTTTFSWNFQNSYNDKKGTATVTMTKEYRPEGTICYYHIVVSSDDIMDFIAVTQ